MLRRIWIHIETLSSWRPRLPNDEQAQCREWVWRRHPMPQQLPERQREFSKVWRRSKQVVRGAAVARLVEPKSCRARRATRLRPYRLPSAWHDQGDNDPSENGDNDVCHERKWQEDTPAQIAPRGGCRKRPQTLAVQECLFKDIKKFSHRGSLANGGFRRRPSKPIHEWNLHRAAERRQRKRVRGVVAQSSRARPISCYSVQRGPETGQAMLAEMTVLACVDLLVKHVLIRAEAQVA